MAVSHLARFIPFLLVVLAFFSCGKPEANSAYKVAPLYLESNGFRLKKVQAFDEVRPFSALPIINTFEIENWKNDVRITRFSVPFNSLWDYQTYAAGYRFQTDSGPIWILDPYVALQQGDHLHMIRGRPKVDPLEFYLEPNFGEITDLQFEPGGVKLNPWEPFGQSGFNNPERGVAFLVEEEMTFGEAVVLMEMAVNAGAKAVSFHNWFGDE